SRSVKTRTRWPKPTGPSPTIAGDPPGSPASLASRGGRFDLDRPRPRPPPPRTVSLIRPPSFKNAPQSQDRGLPQLRNHGAHRRREDDDDGAHPLLHRQEP